MQTYDEMVDSGVDWIGDIPKGWSTARIGSLFKQRNEKVSDKDFEALSVTKKGVVPQLDDAAKTNDGDNRKLVRKGDYVINSRSDRKGSSGLSTLDGSVSLINTVLAEGKLESRYTHHLLRSLPFQEEFYRCGQGIVADLWSTNYQRMKNIHLPVPGSVEQQKIADFLDQETAKIDNLIAKQERLLELLEEKRRATITHAVTRGLNPHVELKETNIPWLGQIPTHWKVQRVKDIASIVLGKMVQNEQKKSDEKLKPYLKSRNIQWDGINLSSVDEMWFKPRELEDYRLKEGDIAVSEGGDVGKCIMWRDAYGEMYFQNSVNRVRVKNSDVAKYVYYVFQHLALNQVFMNTVNRVSIAHLTKDKLVTYHIPMPEKDEQQQVTEYLDNEDEKFRKLKQKIQTQITLLRERRTSLISHAVTGKIKV